MGNSSLYDAIVVGAGPGGAAAAHFLSRAGKKILVLEKQSLPRYKACGGGLSPKILEQFDFSFDPVIEQPVKNVTFALNGKRVNVEIPDDTLIMVLRDRFDEHILANSDIDLRENSRVKEIEENADRVIVKTATGECFSAPYLIGADGANSVVAKELGLRRGKQMVAAIEAEIPLSSNIVAHFNNHAYFIFGELHQGYLWIFPKKNFVSVGAAAFHPGRGVLQSTLARVMKQYGFSLDGVGIHGHPIPITLSDDEIATNRCFLVGDAAGLADPFSGEGIRLAITSGRVAAKAIIQDDPQTYTRLVDQSIRKSHRWGLRLAKLFYSYPELCFSAGVTNPNVFPLFLDMLAGETNYRSLIGKLLLGLPGHLVTILGRT